MSPPRTMHLRILKLLTFAMPLLAVALVASFATLELFGALGDEQVVTAMSWVTRGIAMILMSNVVLLVGCLGLRAVTADELTGGSR